MLSAGTAPRPHDARGPTFFAALGGGPVPCARARVIALRPAITRAALRLVGSKGPTFVAESHHDAAGAAALGERSPLRRLGCRIVDRPAPRRPLIRVDGQTPHAAGAWEAGLFCRPELVREP